jgi:WbqC-like protein
LILTAHQPAYLPWLGFFHKAVLSDVLCIVDTVAYSRYDFVNRNRIKTSAGTAWLTVPVHVQHPERRIRDLRIAGTAWQRKHIAAIRQSYEKTPYFEDYAADVERLLLKPRKFLCELDDDLLRFLLRALNIDVRVIVASDYDFVGAKSDYVLNMCRTLGAKTFVFGLRGREYADRDAFIAAGIQPVFQEYRHPRYRQRYGEFVPALSALDLLFNEGPRSLEVILSGNMRSAGACEAGSRDAE